MNGREFGVLRISRRYPRLFAVAGVFFFTALLWTCVEGVFFCLLKLRGPSLREQLHHWEGGLTQTHPQLGYMPKPGAKVRAHLDGPDGRIFACTYTIGDDGWRITPVDAPEDRDRCALFFGCSFAFGEGVDDDKTLPACFGREAREYQPFNYAFRAYGPQCMYLQVTDPEFGSQVRQRRGIAVYTFINHHLNRLAGAMIVGTTWGRDLPMLTLENGQIVYHGNFETGRPVTQFIYRALRHLPSVEYLGVDWPRADSEANYRLLATVCAGTRDALRRKFDEMTFIVMIFHAQALGRGLQPFLEEAGIPCLDYTDLLVRTSPDQPKFYYVDGHPTAAAHAAIARQLALDVRRLAAQP